MAKQTAAFKFYWTHIDTYGRAAFVAGLPFDVELRGRTPVRLYVNPTRTACLTVRVARSGVLSFLRWGNWTTDDTSAAIREFPTTRPGLVPVPRKSNTGVQKPKEGRTVTFQPRRNRA